MVTFPAVFAQATGRLVQQLLGVVQRRQLVDQLVHVLGKTEHVSSQQKSMKLISTRRVHGTREKGGGGR